MFFSYPLRISPKPPYVKFKTFFITALLIFRVITFWHFIHISIYSKISLISYHRRCNQLLGHMWFLPSYRWQSGKHLSCCNTIWGKDATNSENQNWNRCSLCFYNHIHPLVNTIIQLKDKILDFIVFDS